MNQTSYAPIPVRFETGTHRDKAIIRILFDYNQALSDRVKILPCAAWSRSMKCWYVPDTDAYRQRFRMELKIIPAATLQVSNENSEALAQMVKMLRLKGYSESTITTYRNELTQLLLVLKKVAVHTLTRERLTNYFV